MHWLGHMGVLRVIGGRERPGEWRLDGELDLATRHVLATAIRSGSATGDVSLDAAGVSFVDCSGLGTLIDLAHTVRAGGHRFEITRASGALMRLTRLTGHCELLGVTED
jgi:anti-anti-sigma factor